MLIQLRRVVYLLVLLQCCVSVVYASDAGGGARHSPDDPSVNDNMEWEEEEGRLYEKANKVNIMSVKASNVVTTIETYKELCEESVVVMPNDVDYAIKLIKEFGAVKQKPHDGNGSSEEKLLSEARDAAQKAQKGVEKAKTDAKTTEDYITNYTKEAEDLEVLTKSLSADLEEYLEKTDKDRETYNEENGYQDSVDDGLRAVEKLRNAVKAAEVPLKKVKEELESREKSLEQINQFLQTVQHTTIPPAEVQPTTATENHNGSSEKENEQSVVEGTRGTEGLQNNTHTNSMTEAPKNNTGNSQVHRIPEEKAGGDVNTSKGVHVHQEHGENVMGNVDTSNGTKITGDGEREVGVQNTNEIPQNTTETSTAAPGTVNTESSRVTSGSNSSTSMNLNVSGLRDSSNSPALLHSPLLLLLLCVLGCTLVC